MKHSSIGLSEIKLIALEAFLKLYPKLSVIDQKSMKLAWTLDQWRELESSYSNYQVYTLHHLESGLIGFSLWSISDKDCAHLLKIAILPEMQRSGLGSFLIGENLSALKFTNFYLEVAINNASAIKMYKRMGFEIICQKKKFYSDGMDAYAMQLKAN